MKRNDKYPYASEFEPLERMARICRLPTVTLTPFSLSLLALAHRLAAAVSKLPSGAHCKTLSMEGYNGGKLPVWVFEADDAKEDEPCLIYYHGGGFVNEANGGVKRNACLYALGAHCKVIFINYRLVPKNPFPIPAQDCYLGYRYVLENAKALGVDANRIGVGGDSAGAFFAALVCQMARDKQETPPLFQMLLYPVTDQTLSSESMREYYDAPTWNASLTRQVWNLYLQGATGAYTDLLQTDSFSNLPEAYFETAQYDCLRDEGEHYAARLKEAGVRVSERRIAGAVHGFDWVYESDITKDALKQRIAFLQAQFSQK